MTLHSQSVVGLYINMWGLMIYNDILYSGIYSTSAFNMDT